jgi:hypothetical protein
MMDNAGNLRKMVEIEPVCRVSEDMWYFAICKMWRSLSGCRVETHLDPQAANRAKRRDESRRGRHECLRHVRMDHLVETHAPADSYVGLILNSTYALIEWPVTSAFQPAITSVRSLQKETPGRNCAGEPPVVIAAGNHRN